MSLIHDTSVDLQSLLSRAPVDGMALLYSRLAAEPNDAWLARPANTGTHPSMYAHTPCMPMIDYFRMPTIGVPFEEVIRSVLKSDDSLWLARKSESTAAGTPSECGAHPVHYDLNTWLSRSSIADADRSMHVTCAGGAYDLQQWLQKKI